jgi:16S rRNA (cytosine967-C5)-methyltransferase
MLDRSDLDKRDRGLVTELVYGTVRNRRACDWLVDRFLYDQVAPSVRAALEVGAYQLVFLRQPPHAAVSSTVGAVPKKVRGLVNAVLRRVADDLADGPVDWPDLGTELSYPDWLLQLFIDEHGTDDAVAALRTMNEPPTVTMRDDGYIQDEGSQLVTAAVDVAPGDRILDVCAAPGGKATAMAAAGAWVVGADRRRSRCRLVAANAADLGSDVAVVVADGTAPPFRPGGFDKVLVDAPCSGLGTLRRRADARWRVEPQTADRLARLQLELLVASLPMVRDGGELVYSVCTFTRAETLGVADAVSALEPSLEALAVGAPWRPWGVGGLVLPHDHDTDGMAVFRWRVHR